VICDTKKKQKRLYEGPNSICKLGKGHKSHRIPVDHSSCLLRFATSIRVPFVKGPHAVSTNRGVSAS